MKSHRILYQRSGVTWSRNSIRELMEHYWPEKQTGEESMNTSRTHNSTADFEVDNHGSIFLLRPLTDAGREWAEDHLPADAQRWGNAIVVEHRYIADIVNGIHGDGLEVK